MIHRPPPPFLHKPHASFNDWGFENANWRLVTTQFVSLPSSLSAVGTCTVLCKRMGYLGLVDGQMSTWWRTSILGGPKRLIFRNQAIDPAVNYLNCYYIQQIQNQLYYRLYRRVAGVDTMVVQIGGCPAVNLNQWYNFRVSWWSDWGQLRVRLERWVGDGYELEGTDDAIDPLDMWNATGVGRSGIYLSSASVWYDDTVTLKPVA